MGCKLRKRNVNYLYYKKLSEEHKVIDSKLDHIRTDINSNAFISMFNTRGKERGSYILKFFLTSIFMMCVVFVIFYLFFYRNLSFGDKALEIFGNGLFWIIAVIVYWFISHFLDDRKVKRSEKNSAKSR